MIRKSLLAWLLPALFVPATLPADDTLSQAINSLADRYYDFRLRTQPGIAYFSGVEIERHDGLYDNSDSHCMQGLPPRPMSVASWSACADTLQDLQSP